MTKKALQEKYRTFMQEFASSAGLANNALAKDYASKLARDSFTAEKLHDQRTQTKGK